MSLPIANPNSKPSVLAGVGWALLGTFMFSLILAMGRVIGVTVQIPALQIIFLRYVGGLVTITIIMLLGSKFQTTLRPKTGLVTHAWRAAFGSAGVVCSLYASTHMPFADAAAISLIQGVLVVILAIIFLNETISWERAIAGVICVLGACIVVLGQNDLRLPQLGQLWPTIVGFAGALFIAAELVLVRTLAVRDSPLAVLFYINFFASALLLIPVLIVWRPLQTSGLPLLLLLGPLAILAQYFNIRAFRLAEASLLGPVSYSRLIFAAILGYWIFAEVPVMTTWIGGAITIVGGIALIKLHAPRKARPLGKPVRVDQ
jgi:drug/metabolite transporter (DMT)-like permease